MRVSHNQFQRAFKQSIEQTKRDNIAQLIDAVATVDDDAVLARLAAIESNQEFAVSIEISEDAELSALSEINCSKSGQFMGMIDLKEMAQLIDINGKERVKYMLKKRAITAIENKWLFTDERALDNLSEHDPLGYFVYAASNILRAFQPGFSKGHNQFSNDDTDAHFRFIASKRELWTQLHKLPMSTIVRGNEIMRRYLTFINSACADHLVKFTETNLACLNVDQFIKDVSNSISLVINHEFDKGRIKSTVTYSDVVDLKILYQGHSNFRRQRNLASLNETDQIVYQLQGFMDDARYDEYAKSSSPWQLRDLPRANEGETNIREHTGLLTLKKAEPKADKPLKVSFATLLRSSRDKG